MDLEVSVQDIDRIGKISMGVRVSILGSLRLTCSMFTKGPGAMGRSGEKILPEGGPPVGALPRARRPAAPHLAEDHDDRRSSSATSVATMGTGFPPNPDVTRGGTSHPLLANIRIAILPLSTPSLANMCNGSLEGRDLPGFGFLERSNSHPTTKSTRRKLGSAFTSGCGRKRKHAAHPILREILRRRIRVQVRRKTHPETSGAAKRRGSTS